MKKVFMLIFLTLALTGCSEDDDGNDLFESWGNPSTKSIDNSEGTFTRTQYCRIYDNGDGKCVEKDFDANVLTEMEIKNASFYSYEEGSMKDDSYKYTAGDVSLGNRDEQISLVYISNPVIVGKDRVKGSFVEFRSLENSNSHVLKAGNILKDGNTSVLKERHGIEITYNFTGNTAAIDIIKIELIDDLVVKRECRAVGDSFDCTDPNDLGAGVQNKISKQAIAKIIPAFPKDKGDRLYKTDITYLILEAFKFQNFK